MCDFNEEQINGNGRQAPNIPRKILIRWSVRKKQDRDVSNGADKSVMDLQI